MPRTIEDGFRDFLSKLTPSTGESSAVSSHRASIKDCLERNFGLNRFYRIGSFGNGTSIYGYSDVDYLACLPAKEGTIYSSTFLTKVRTALDNRFPRTGVRANCPAVQIPFGTYRAETTEVVPALEAGERYGVKVYKIADCSEGWMTISPDLHIGYVKIQDDRLNAKVRPLIRFLKAWKFFNNVPISSFYLELRVAKFASGESAIVYQYDIKTVLKQLIDCNLASIQDPMEVSGYIGACKTQSQREEAISKLNTACTRAENALSCLGQDKTSEAFYWWNLLFAGNFPSYNY